MKNHAIILIIALSATMTSCGQSLSEHPLRLSDGLPENSNALLASGAPAVHPAKPSAAAGKKKIKIAILLDTSNSMDGLIVQAKNQLWKIVTQLAKAKDAEGEDPLVELALYHYGNAGLSAMSGYVQRVSHFTTELDEISEKLFSLATNGGSEYCGTVIKASLDELEWSDNEGDLQLIFIAGNEPFTQGSVNYRASCKAAASRNIIVNTIFCGNYQEGINTNWKDGADIGMGKYMNIDHDALVVHISSPYDAQIAQINIRLNNTYLPYGREGAVKKEKQTKEDANSLSYGEANAVSRYLSKGSKVYKNTSWDLVDASDETDFDISKIPAEQLPEEMRSLSNDEKTAYIKQYKAERAAIKKEMNELNKKREEYVAQKKREQAQSGSTQLEDALIGIIVEQAKLKSFRFEDEIN